MTDHNPISHIDTDLEQHRDFKLLCIDKRTDELIASGFTYDGKVFGMSTVAQTDWIGLKQADQNDLISYPFEVSAMDHSSYSFANKQAVSDFYVAGMGHKLAHVGSGRALKVQVLAATDIAGINAVVDNR